MMNSKNLSPDHIPEDVILEGLALEVKQHPRIQSGGPEKSQKYSVS